LLWSPHLKPFFPSSFTLSIINKTAPAGLSLPRFI
jgi:hypothetical protein